MLSCGAMSAITWWIRAITCLKLNVAEASVKPYRSACRIWCCSLAVRIRALLGTQPKFRQSPPILCASTSVTLALTAAAM